MVEKNPVRASTLNEGGKELAAAIMGAGAGIKMNQQLARDLAKLLVTSGDDVITALKELLAQPDPKKLLKEILRTKANDYLMDWATGHPDDFAEWVKSANLCLHAVAQTMPDSGDRKISDIVQGVRHYREDSHGYSDTQMRDFALIAAKAEYMLEQEDEDSAIIPFWSHLTTRKELSQMAGHDHFNCCPLTSEIVKSIVVNDPESVPEIMRIIEQHGNPTEAAILHILDGGHTSLTQGVL